MFSWTKFLTHLLFQIKKKNLRVVPKYWFCLQTSSRFPCTVFIWIIPKCLINGCIERYVFTTQHSASLWKTFQLLTSSLIQLITSPRFHYYVRTVHAMMNNLPPPPPLHRNHGGMWSKHQSYDGFSRFAEPENFKPTIRQKWNAYFKIWREEMKDTFLFRKWNCSWLIFDRLHSYIDFINTR